MRAWTLSCCALLAAACGGSDATIGDGGGAGEGGGADAQGDGAAGGDGGGNDAGDSGDGGDSGSDSGSSPRGRLFVSNGSAAPAVWDGLSGIATNVAPTFTLSASAVSGGTHAVALANKRLFFGVESTTNTLVAFDSADTLTAPAAPAAIVPAAHFVSIPNGGPIPNLIQWDATTDFLFTSNMSGTESFSGAGSITSSSNAKAAFSHSWLQLPGAAYDPGGDRLFLGQISGAGVLAWSGAKSATGAPASSFTLNASTAAWSMSVDATNDRLYAIGPYTGSGNSHEAIEVWRGISGVSAAKAPDFTMGSASGLASTDFSPWITVENDTLIACVQSGKVLLWTSASTLSGDKAPTQTITVGGLNNGPKKAVLGPVTGRLYVLDGSGVSIFATPTTSPTLVTKLTMGMSKPYDFAVLE